MDDTFENGPKFAQPHEDSCQRCGVYTPGVQFCDECAEQEGEYDYSADDLAFDAARERAVFGR